MHITGEPAGNRCRKILSFIIDKRSNEQSNVSSKTSKNEIDPKNRKSE